MIFSYNRIILIILGVSILIKNSKDYILVLRFLILSFCLVEYLIGEDYNAVIIIIALSYIILNTLLFLSNNKIYKIFWILLSIILCLYTSKQLNEIFYVLIPVNVMDLWAIVNSALLIIPIFILLVSIALPLKIVPLFLLISIIVFLFQCIVKKYIVTLETLINENDELREMNSIYSMKIKSMKNYEKQSLYATKLEERSKISQEMHDKIGHTISGSILQLEAAKLLLNKDKDKSEKILNNTINVLREGLEDIRIILRRIRPTKEEMGINRIKLLLAEAMQNTKFTYALSFQGDIDNIAYAHWKAIYDNLTEAITNIMKYSKGDFVEVNIQVLNRIVKASIKDNGMVEGVISKGLGLKGIEQRCVDMGGTAIIDFSDGFSIIMILPIK